MAHRKLQQEIDKVFKKINEGLEIFNTYYERHENCTNNPSQKDKLEADLKREVKKLQRLREQIKSWQSSPDIKDKDSLLDYRRSVEVAMEKYKAVEKASKEKAYSNMSLKKSETLDPEEMERRDVTNYLSQSIDELERQYDALQVEADRLILLNKKKKTATVANEQKKNKLKEMQLRYRWHQQQMELALRLIANEELNPQDVKDIEDDINFFIESNQEPDFVEDETIYDGLNLDSNEAIAHEVAASFAAQMNDESEEESSKDSSKLSKKEQRKLEREAKRAAKAAAKAVTPGEEHANISGQNDLTKSVDSVEQSKDSVSVSPSASPSPVPSSMGVSIPSTANTTLPNGTSTAGSSVGIVNRNQGTQVKILSRESTPELQGHTHIHQSLNGITTTSTLKPATVPVRPAGDLRWAVAATQAAEREKKINASNGTSTISASSSNNNSRNTSVSNTPVLPTYSLSTSHEKPSLASKVLAGAVTNGQQQGNNQSSPIIKHSELSKQTDVQDVPSSAMEPELVDDYDSEESDEDEPLNTEIIELSEEEKQRREQVTNHLKHVLCDDSELLLLPGGIQDMIISSLLSRNKMEDANGRKSNIQTLSDACQVSRLEMIPSGVNPPSPLDAFRSTSQWDSTRCSLRDEIATIEGDDETKLKTLLPRFGPLETFSLFYNYYYSVTPLEKKIAYSLLTERDWKISKSGDTWFLRHGNPKFSNELCEVADFKIFKLDDWTVVDKLNFKLDYSLLRNPPVTQPDVSNGQQLLQQLKQGGLLAKPGFVAAQ